MSARAQVLAISGWAVITDHANGKVYSVQKEHDFELEDATNLHIGMFLQPAMNKLNLYEIDAGEYPFTACIEHIKLDHKLYIALTLFQDACSPLLNKELRTESGLMAEELFKDNAVYSYVREIFMGIPFPNDAVTTDYPPNGRCAELVKELLAQTRPAKL